MIDTSRERSNQIPDLQALQDILFLSSAASIQFPNTETQESLKNKTRMTISKSSEAQNAKDMGKM